jgi:hypothetical protein
MLLACRYVTVYRMGDPAVPCLLALALFANWSLMIKSRAVQSLFDVDIGENGHATKETLIEP